MTYDNNELNEAETRAELIDPALRAAGWGEIAKSRIRREVISEGRLLGGGKRADKDIADYVLIYRGQKLAVVEAKKYCLAVTEGLAQAKRYAERLQVRFCYSTNGRGVYQADIEEGKEGDIGSFPTPEQLWDMTFSQPDSWRERFGDIPFQDKGGQWQARYYQHNAINKVLENISAGKDRILLTLATGTGKTAIAFQIAWKLFHAKWNLNDWKDGTEPSRRPRILFLADRNILADQAFNAFSSFPEDALIRIAPNAIRKSGSVPKNGSIFFTIFQTFMSGTDFEGSPAPYFGEYPEDFFDFIVIDECHRGGGNDESSWRAIMDYFSPAVQLGLTATPKRKLNSDTYKYFGEPVYIYSLKEGINDGYLSPFRVRQIATTIDEYAYTSDDTVVEGEIDNQKVYRENDFNRIIEIKEREEYRVGLFMKELNPKQKTIVFCGSQDHALAVRDLVNQISESKNPNYCVRVTADDGAEGERMLRAFQNNDKTIPTILTTSKKLSTGVDARNVRNIILMRPINSMIEFKQIIGRGTRLFDGKDYFTIYDFVKAYKLFYDPEWDGEPPEPLERPGPSTPSGGEGGEPVPPEPAPRAEKIIVRLADGKKRTIDSMVSTQFYDPSGMPISAAEFVKKLFGVLPEMFINEEELRSIWSDPSTRRKLLDGLSEKGFGVDRLIDVGCLISAEESDIYDILAYIAFELAPITREERAESHRPQIFKHYNDKQQEFLGFVLEHYISEGVKELDSEKLPELIKLKYHATSDAVDVLGSVGQIRDVFVGFQKHLYA